MTYLSALLQQSLPWPGLRRDWQPASVCKVWTVSLESLFDYDTDYVAEAPVLTTYCFATTGDHLA